MVIVLDAHEAETPAGKPFAPETPEFEIPVAPVVAIVIFGEIAVLIRNVGELDGTPAVIATFITVMVPVAFTVPQPPVNGIV